VTLNRSRTEKGERTIRIGTDESGKPGGISFLERITRTYRGKGVATFVGKEAGGGGKLIREYGKGNQMMEGRRCKSGECPLQLKSVFSQE